MKKEQLPDIGKVLEGIRHHCGYFRSGCWEEGYPEKDRCPYYDNAKCGDDLMRDAAVLLEKLVPVPAIHEEPGHNDDNWFSCSACHGPTFYHAKYCHHCGRPLTFDW